MIVSDSKIGSYVEDVQSKIDSDKKEDDKKDNDDENEDYCDDWDHIMNQMDKELQMKQKKGNNGRKNTDCKNENNNNETNYDRELEPLNLDLNLVHNILESHLQAQNDSSNVYPGPANLLLSQFGFNLPAQSRSQK